MQYIDHDRLEKRNARKKGQKKQNRSIPTVADPYSNCQL